MTTSTWYLAPADDRRNEYAAGYDGNAFATREEAESAIPSPFQCAGSCVGHHSPECDAAWELHKAEAARVGDLRSLCYRYNDATNPAAFRCDDEHKRFNELARQLRADLRRRFREGVDYRETESGRFLPMA